MDNNSFITTSAKNSNGMGNNITITNSNLVLLQNNSNILANTVDGGEGKINFYTKLLFTNLSSNIDAASMLGLDKTIVIKSSKLQQQLLSSILPEQIATLIVNQKASAYVNNANLTQLSKKSQPSVIITQADSLIKSPLGEIELVSTVSVTFNCQ